MKKVAARLVALGFVAACSIQGCGNQPATEASGDAHRLEPATPRGLAAGVLAHLDADDVASVSGTDRNGPLSVDIRLTDPTMSVTVFVSKPMAGMTTCGGDGGYTRISCEQQRGYVEVVERRGDNTHMPAYIGRTQSMKRGAVLIEVSGSKSRATVDLLQSLLADDLIGLETSTARNADGEDLPAFGELTFSSSIERQ